MPSVEELYKNKMTWPRLILKGIVEALLAYNCFHYNTSHLAGYDCYSNGKKQPNDLGDGRNMT